MDAASLAPLFHRPRLGELGRTVRRIRPGGDEGSRASDRPRRRPGVQHSRQTAVHTNPEGQHKDRTDGRLHGRHSGTLQQFVHCQQGQQRNRRESSKIAA